MQPAEIASATRNLMLFPFDQREERKACQEQKEGTLLGMGKKGKKKKKTTVNFDDR